MRVVNKMSYRPLGRTGLKVSAIGLGTSSLGGVFGEVDHQECLEVVRSALRLGINVIDSAPWYGHGRSEAVVGEALKGIPRDAYYLTTKVGRYAPCVENMFDFRAERVTQSVHESLARLGVDYLDIVQIHDPEFSPSLDIILKETLPALIKLKDSGIVRFVGITGYPLEVLRYLVDHSPPGTIDTCLSYCHYTLMDTSLEEQLLPALSQRGVGCLNAAPMGMGLLTLRGPPAWHPATSYQKHICQQAVAFCESQGVNISKLAINFSTRLESIPTTLVSTSNKQMLADNVVWAQTEKLSEEEEAVLETCRRDYFSLLRGQSWEGKEVAAYWESVGKRHLLRTLYQRAVDDV